MNFLNRIFGIAKEIRYGVTGFFGSGTLAPKWSALEAQAFYNKVPELRAIIDAQAAMFSKIKFQYVDSKGNYAETPVKTLFEKPNPYQDAVEFETLSHKIFNLHGIVFFYLDLNGQKTISDFGLTHIYPLAISEMDFMKTNKKERVSKWQDLYTEISAILPYTAGQNVKLNKDNLYFIADSNVSINTALNGNAKIDAARMALDNLVAVSESENVLLNNRGMVGIFSPKSLGKDDFGGFVIADEKAQKAFDERIKSFGTMPGQSQLITTGTPFEFTRTILTPAELGLEDSRKRNKIAVNDVFQHSILLSNEYEGSTFNNMNAIKSGIYENTIIPVAIKFADFKTATFAKNGGKFIIDISDIESLKADNKITADTNKANADLIIMLNKEVQAGSITFDIAVSFLVNQCNYEQKEAELLINKTVKTTQNVE